MKLLKCLHYIIFGYVVFHVLLHYLSLSQWAAILTSYTALSSTLHFFIILYHVDEK